MPSSAGDWLWAAYLSAAVALFVGSATIATAWQTPLGLILSACSVLAVAVGIYLHDPEPRGPWLLLAAGQLFFAMGDLAGDSVYHALGTAPYPGVADLFYLIAYPIITLGFARLVLRRNPGPGFGVLLDGGILTVGLVLVVWVAFADPLLSATSLSPLGRATSIVYLVADTALVGVVACLVLDSDAGTPAMRLFAGSVVALLVADGFQVRDRAGSSSRWQRRPISPSTRCGPRRLSIRRSPSRRARARTRNSASRRAGWPP